MLLMLSGRCSWKVHLMNVAERSASAKKVRTATKPPRTVSVFSWRLFSVRHTCESSRITLLKPTESWSH